MNFKNFGKNEIKQATKFEDVLNYGVWHLGRKDHSTYELREKLYRKTDNEDWINQTIRYLTEQRYLDDKRFTENFLKDYNEFKQFGPSKIKQELKQKGIDIQTINNSILESEFDYFESALNCLNKKQRTEITDRKERDKLTRFLLSRGFSFDMIKYAFEEHLK